jgi:protein-S-isoprenylcysteine O-methyltransferase Ste14
MRKGKAAFGSALFLVLAPGTVAGLIPWAITRWTMPGPDWPPVLLLPPVALLIGGGLIVLLDSFWRFAREGLGTPTPLLPTNRLIVTGLYRHVRNPMYVAVLSVIIGQAVLFGAVCLGLYAAIVWAIFHSSVLLYEEPKLRADFGATFDVYGQHVPRWIPRLRPWVGA